MGQNIIFLDDDRNFLNSLERYFMKVNMQWDTDFFTKQDEALESVASHDEAILVLDWAMPGMDGMACARKAKEIASRTGSRLHIIMLTGHSGVDNTVSALEVGADDYISKPVDLYSLKQHIQLGLNSLEQETEQLN